MAQYYLKHYGIVSDDIFDSDFLEHHGIQGQKWGIKNGPPYPLSEKKHDVVVNKAKDNEYPAWKRERDKHQPYTYFQKRSLRSHFPDKIWREERKIQKREKNYIKDRNKHAEFDSKTHLYKKRKDTSEDEDLAIVNIKKDSKGAGPHNNCVLCSVAYELRRRGFDCLANNAVNGYDDDEILRMFKGLKVNETANRLTKKKDKTTQLETVTAKDINKYVKEVMKSYGKLENNSRGIAVLKWASPYDPRITYGGHCVNWEKKNGKFQILDGQTNKKYPEGEELSKMLSKTNKIDFMRVDNLEPDYEYIQQMALVKRPVEFRS